MEVEALKRDYMHDCLQQEHHSETKSDGLNICLFGPTLFKPSVEEQARSNEQCKE